MDLIKDKTRFGVFIIWGNKYEAADDLISQQTMVRDHTQNLPMDDILTVYVW